MMENDVFIRYIFIVDLHRQSPYALRRAHGHSDKSALCGRRNWQTGNRHVMCMMSHLNKHDDDDKMTVTLAIKYNNNVHTCFDKDNSFAAIKQLNSNQQQQLEPTHKIDWYKCRRSQRNRSTCMHNEWQNVLKALKAFCHHKKKRCVLRLIASMYFSFVSRFSFGCRY